MLHVIGNKLAWIFLHRQLHNSIHLRVINIIIAYAL